MHLLVLLLRIPANSRASTNSEGVREARRRWGYVDSVDTRGRWWRGGGEGEVEEKGK